MFRFQMEPTLRSTLDKACAVSGAANNHVVVMAFSDYGHVTFVTYDRVDWHFVTDSGDCGRVPQGKRQIVEMACPLFAMLGAAEFFVALARRTPLP